MKNNTSNHEKNGPESLKLLRVPSTPPTTPTTPTTPRGLEDVFKDLPITDETSCGIWCIRNPTLQRFANKKAYVFLYGVLGCIFSASYAYFNGTITTIEKRFKIPSKTTGGNLLWDVIYFLEIVAVYRRRIFTWDRMLKIVFFSPGLISVGNDISQLFVSVVLSYYAGRGHRPRWIAFGIYTVSINLSVVSPLSISHLLSISYSSSRSRRAKRKFVAISCRHTPQRMS